MAQLLFSNNAATLLGAGLNSVATTLTVNATTGELFPNPTGSQYFVITLTDALSGEIHEIMWCTARDVDTFTVVRGQEGTTATSWLAGDAVANLWTAGQAATIDAAVQFPVDALLGTNSEGTVISITVGTGLVLASGTLSVSS